MKSVIVIYCIKIRILYVWNCGHSCFDRYRPTTGFEITTIHPNSADKGPDDEGIYLCEDMGWHNED
jgi:hypothetical protein